MTYARTIVRLSGEVIPNEVERLLAEGVASEP
jgi:hypothetical protein